MTRPPKDSRDAVANEFGRRDGERIEGGCDHCAAYQTIAVEGPGVWLATVHHDPWCPVFKAAQR